MFVESESLNQLKFGLGDLFQKNKLNNMNIKTSINRINLDLFMNLRLSEKYLNSLPDFVL